MERNSVWFIRLGILVVLAAVNLWLLFGTKHARTKMTLLPVLIVLAGASWALLSVLRVIRGPSLYLEIPLLVLITLGNLWQFRVCGSCARLVRGDFFSRPKLCDSCGAKLGAQRS